MHKPGVRVEYKLTNRTDWKTLPSYSSCPKPRHVHTLETIVEGLQSVRPMICNFIAPGNHLDSASARTAQFPAHFFHLPEILFSIFLSGSPLGSPSFCATPFLERGDR